VADAPLEVLEVDLIAAVDHFHHALFGLVPVARRSP
jgi:hypothetical protein